MIDELTHSLMEKYNWTPDQIDGLDFYRTLDLTIKEAIEANKEPLVFIDQVFGT